MNEGKEDYRRYNVLSTRYHVLSTKYKDIALRSFRKKNWSENESLLCTS